MIRVGSKTSPAYNVESDLEYTEHLLISILMLCGYEDYNVLNYSIDEVVLKIKETLPTVRGSFITAANAIVDETKYRILDSYRDLWFNYQLIRSSVQDV